MVKTGRDSGKATRDRAEPEVGPLCGPVSQPSHEIRDVQTIAREFLQVLRDTLDKLTPDDLKQTEFVVQVLSPQ